MTIVRSGPRASWLLALTVACGGDDLVLPGGGEPASIEVVRGNDQFGRVGEPLGQPIVVRVSDSRGRPLTDVPLVLGLDGDQGAEVTPDTTSTGVSGEADFRVVLGTRIGPVSGEAKVASETADLRAAVRLTALSADAVGMTMLSGDGQSAAIGFPLPDPLVVQVADGFGNPIAGVPISWTAVDGGSVSASVVETDAEGRSSVERTLGGTAGFQFTTAGADGLAGSPITFEHMATAGAAAQLIMVSGNGQSAIAGTPVANELVVRLVDDAGNPVADMAVAWIAGEGGGLLAPQRAPTGPDGTAATRWTLGPAPGGQTASAVVSGVGVVVFQATAVAGTPPGMRLLTQPSGSARRGVVLDRQPAVQLLEPGGGDLAQAGVTVRVAVASGEGRLSGTVTRTTDAAGRATFTDLALEGPPGAYTLAFGSPGFTGVVSQPVTLARARTVTTIESDTPDPSTPGTAVRVVYRVVSEGGQAPGSVAVQGDEGASCQATVSAGACSITMSRAGGQRITASYAGSDQFEPSSDAEDHVVTAPGPAATTTSIVSDAPDPSLPGQPVEVRFTVGSAAGTPPGNVTVTATSGETCTGSIAAGGCTITLGQSGARTLVARYPGGGGFAASEDAEAHTVNAPPPAGPSPSASDVRVEPAAIEAVRGRATVEVVVRDASGATLPGIGVQISVSGSGNTVEPGSATTDGSGLARFEVRSTVAETKTITAVAGGVALDDRPSVTVNRISTDIRIESDEPDPSDPGTAVTVRFRVRSPEGTPSGDVTVSGGGGSCVASLASDGTGACPLTLSTPGSVTLTATYGGDATFAGSQDEDGHQVRAPAERVLKLETQPSKDAESGVPFDHQPEVQLALERGGDVEEAGVAITARLASGGGSLQGQVTVTTDADGRAVFADLAIVGQGKHTLAFSAAGYREVVSKAVEVKVPR